MIHFCTTTHALRALAVGTHDGSFHADEVFATAILLLAFGKLDVVRSRDPEALRLRTVVLDVGGVYDPGNGRFDHHQKGGARSREDGVPYATAGLVWDYFAGAVIYALAPEVSRSDASGLRQQLDAEFFRHVDAVDCGIDIPGPHAVQVSSLISGFNPVWGESADYDKGFEKAVRFAAQILENLVREAVSKLKAAEVVKRADTLHDGQIVLLNTAVPWAEAVTETMPDALYVVYPDVTGGNWLVQAVRAARKGFKVRKDLPAEWAGLRGKALDAVANVNGCVFCHDGRFICGHQNKAGAVQLAALALLN